jgi:hypothetical protein
LSRDLFSGTTKKHRNKVHSRRGEGNRERGGGTVSYLVVDSTGAHQSTDAGVQKVRVYILGLKKVLAF